ncbi:hypothetical protein [Photobacterium leiognathi]|uniref:hypothetical protein n=1 Tax=Photobacterium leiognathi TaxID=553611 RepID=UPI002981FC55|nr:hypothetical protein [Photobacterium leiognathi]
MDQKKEDVQCFVIMPISSQNGYDDGHFQLVYEDIIKPAIDNAGMSPFRADETKNTNLIQLDILKNVIESPIAICDMSSKNPNVFYELGMRQAFDLPTVLLRDEVTDAPFDINGLRYVTYQKGMKHRDVKDAVAQLSQALIDTYAKKDDKTEINSLIRLMELANPAKLNQVELSTEARYEKLNELYLQEVITSLNLLREEQKSLRTLINNDLLFDFSDEKDGVSKFGRREPMNLDVRKKKTYVRTNLVNKFDL